MTPHDAPPPPRENLEQRTLALERRLEDLYGKLADHKSDLSKLSREVARLREEVEERQQI